MTAASPVYETLALSRPAPHILHVELNRSNYANAMNAAFWADMRACFGAIANDADIRAVVISGRGKHFSAGLDMRPGQLPLASISQGAAGDPEVGLKLQALIAAMQDSFTAITRCRQPVIAAIHGACIGVRRAIGSRIHAAAATLQMHASGTKS